MYLLFHEDRFVGFTNFKEIIRQCEQERSQSDLYHVQKVKDGDYPPLLELDRYSYNEYELIRYPTLNRVLAGHEYQILREIISQRARDLADSCIYLQHTLGFVKLKEHEEKPIQLFLTILERIKDDLTMPESCVDVHEYFKTDEILDKILIRGINFIE